MVYDMVVYRIDGGSRLHQMEETDMKKRSLQMILGLILAAMLLACAAPAPTEEQSEGPVTTVGAYLSPAVYGYNNNRPAYNFYVVDFAQSELVLYSDGTYMAQLTDAAFSGIELSENTNDITANERTNFIIKFYGAYTSVTNDLDDDLTDVTLASPTRIQQTMDQSYWLDTDAWTEAMGKAVTPKEMDPSTGAMITSDAEPWTAEQFLAATAFPEMTISVNEKNASFDFTSFGIATGFTGGSVKKEEAPVSDADKSAMANAVSSTYYTKSDAPGNADKYAVANTETLSDSPVKGNTYYWLGSSVVYGAASGGESVADYFAKKYDCISIKEAVSGTTLANLRDDSYVARFDAYLASADKADKLDGFICQLSTNDSSLENALGSVTDASVTDPAAFDTVTTCGALEYILATAKQTWGCPLYVFTSPKFDSETYDQMVAVLDRIAAKWGATVIDMNRDAAFNGITDEQRTLYMADNVHPTKAGYREWWLPKFEVALLGN